MGKVFERDETIDSLEAAAQGDQADLCRGAEDGLDSMLPSTCSSNGLGRRMRRWQMPSTTTKPHASLANFDLVQANEQFALIEGGGKLAGDKPIVTDQAQFMRAGAQFNRQHKMKWIGR